MITIDGGTAGGQLLRTALSLSAITKQPFKITDIRGRRSNPGLQPQHLTAVQAAREICSAEVKGASLKSNSLEFIPHDLKGGNYTFDIGTAGSTTLLLQTILPVLLKADQPSEVTVLGGTDTKWAVPSMDFKNVFLEYLDKIGIETEFEIEKFGFYPKGGGKVSLKVCPATLLRKLDIMKRGNPEMLNIISYCSNDLKKSEVAERMVKSFKENFNFDKETVADIKYFNTLSTGGFINAHVHFQNCILSQTCLAERGKKAEDVGRECAGLLKKELSSESTADIHTSDQLMIYMAMSGGGYIKIAEVTEHMKTNASVIEKFLPVRFDFSDNSIKCNKI